MSQSDLVETIVPPVVAFFVFAAVLTVAVVVCLVSAVKR